MDMFGCYYLICFSGALQYLNRINKRGGGVALYVDSDLKCKQVEHDNVIDALMECITVEIEMEKLKHIVVTCVYKTPGTNVETFKDSMKNLMNGLKESRTVNICGDFNIDLINVSKHKTYCLDLFYIRGMYPKLQNLVE